MTGLAPIPASDITAIGPYFAFGSAHVSAAGGWRAAPELITDDGCLGQMIDDAALGLGTAQRWIAASVFFQGWAARLTSIYAASACLCGAVPDLRADLVSWRPRHPGPVELNVAPLLSLPPAAGWRSLRERHLDPLAAAIRRRVRIGRYLLAGNAASALAGALGTIAAQRSRPLGSLVSSHWAQPADVASYGRWLRTPAGPRYARTTCCGYEQLDQGFRCGDCSLNWHGQRWPVLAPPQAAPSDGPAQP